MTKSRPAFGYSAGFAVAEAAAVDITLSDAEIKSLEQGFPPQAAAGLRYPEFQLKMMGI